MKNLISQVILVMGLVSLWTGCSGDNECDSSCPSGQVQLLDCRCVVDANTIVPDPCLDTAPCAVGEVKVYPGCNCQDLMSLPCNGKTCADGEILNAATCNCEIIPDPIGSVAVTGAISTDTEWTKDNIYIIAGKVPVLEGATLTIEAGTIVKGSTGTGANASALVIARGAKLMASGNATSPIIFTSVLDNIQPGQILSPNLTEADNALWGGLIILGYAPISAGDGDDVSQIEGIVADDLFGRYGGTDAADNSGVIQYVSVRHGGAEIGAGNEINGITLGGVGSETIIENIEVVANLDDGVEWFGGTVNVTNVVVANGEDDGLDIDQNYSGTITNAFVIQSGATKGDNALEIDGPEGTLSDGLFTINGLTLIDEDGGADTGADLKSKTQGTINNASWRGYTDNVKIRSSCESDCSTVKSDSYANYISGNLKITNSEWVGTAALSDWTTVYGDADCEDDAKCNISADMQTMITDLLTAEGNVISATATKGADPAPFDGWSWVAAMNKLQ